jgi:hypothetical protein
MPSQLGGRRFLAGVIAVVCLGVAFGVIQQHQVGWNEYSHYDQVRAVDHGTPYIDEWRHTTGDRGVYNGHFTSDKAPGLGLLTLPVYHVARAVGFIGSPQHSSSLDRSAVHLLVIFGCTLPVVLIMLLALWLVERRDPGRGASVAVTLGLSTLLLPFATLFFSHVLSACLGFAAFCLLWRERERGRQRTWVIVAAGVVAGYAVSTEYPLAVLALLLGLYVGWRRDPIRPMVAYGAGVVVGLAPLLLYDWWAFGSPLHLSYSYVAANSSGVLGLGAPSVRTLVRLLVADRGLFVVTPVTAAALAGIVILYREGRRADALVPAAVVLGYLGYNACYYLPFGGGVPGPRFLITILPFLAVPLAATYRRAPLATLALALVSAAIMTVATITGPILDTGKSTHVWYRRLEAGAFKTPHWTIVVFGVMVLIAIVLAARVTPRPRVGRRDVEYAVLGVGGWLAFMRAGPILLQRDHFTGHIWGMLALILLGIALTGIAFALAFRSETVLLAGIPLVPFIVRSLDHTPLSLILSAVSVGMLILLTRPPHWGALIRSAGGRRPRVEASGGGANPQAAGEAQGLVD